MTAVLLGEGGVRLTIENPSSLVGRRDRITNVVPDVDLTNLDPGRIVSRRHAQLEAEGDGYILRDLGSTNGTFVAGRRLPATVGCPLADGDEISFGGVTVVFTIEGAEPRPETAAPTEADPEETIVVASRTHAQPGPAMCAVHPDVAPVGICPECLQPYCANCLRRGDRMLCERCAEMLATVPG